MGKEKAGPLTPKAIANRIKAKGLQKLRWYCQMCQKQCRDENGFKCHTMSESHQRQLLLFADNPDDYIDSFSKEFEEGFLTLVKRSFGTRRVHANQVYQQYISDRNHLHMNATQWETLTEFVKWLGREGKCKVDETEKGWFITYIDRDPETIERQKALEAKEKMELDDQEKVAKFIEKQIERERVRKGEQPEAVYTELKRDDEEEKVTFNLGGLKKIDDKAGPTEHSSSDGASVSSARSKNVLESRSLTEKSTEKDGESSGVKEKAKQKEKQKERKRKSALDEIMEMEEMKKQKVSRKDFWLAKGIIVKVVHKKFGEKYYKKKGVVKEVQNRYVGIVKMLDSGDVLKIDQEHLETVIPALGKTVLVVNGMHRGALATLLSLDEKSYSVNVKLEDGPHRGRTVEKVAYEDIGKLSS